MNLEELGKLKYADKGQFESVLNFISQITNAKIKKPNDADDAITILGISDLREDVAHPSISVALALQNAKKQDGTYFIVPQVVE